jgi:hypothetical protein
MDKKRTRLRLMPFWVIISVFVISSCSTEEMDNLQVEKHLSNETTDSAEDYNLKKGNADQNQILAQIRKATAKYHNLDKAAADGYILDPYCVEHPQFGAMGKHAINTSRIGPFVKPSEPGILLYEPMQNGKYKLVAAEFLVPAEPWDAVHGDTPPMLGDVEFDDHREIIYVDNEEGDLVPVNAKGGPPFPHYQLHVWVWKNNPLGMYFPFNPNVSCQYAGNGDID